jgi:transcriptional regulator
MYLPEHFAAPSTGAIHDVVTAVRIGELVTFDGSALTASTMPWVLDRDRGEFGVLRGHLARANPQWASARADVEAMVIFRGPDAYVSPSYYPSKPRHGKVVPTWNYIAAHATGPLTIHDDPVWIERIVRDLTSLHESPLAEPWSVDDAPRSYIEAMLGQIVGIEIPITRLEGKWKLSQNRAAEDQAGVMAALAAGSPTDRAVADEMLRNPSKA